MLLMFPGCNDDPDPCPDPEPVDLRQNFSEDEFEHAIIGTWTSAYKHPHDASVMYLRIDCEKRVKMHIEENDVSVSYVGDLTVEYLRPTSPDDVTLAKMIITTKNEVIILSDVMFARNNAISAEKLYLRNLSSPYATLEWSD